MASTASDAPQERYGISLQTLYDLPNEPFYITQKEAARLLIDTFNGQESRATDSSAWFEDFWKEWEANESRIVHEVTAGKNVVRYIRTAAVHITREKQFRGADRRNPELKRTAEMLIEFIVEKDGTLKLRKFQNSLSGKLRWDEHRPEKALIREIREELGIDISGRQLKKELRLVPPRGFIYWKGSRETVGSELDEHPSHKYPGVRTHNQIFHYLWTMPKRYWRDVYVEPLKNGRTLVHIWAPAENSRYDPESMLTYIREYMQLRIIRHI